MRSIDPAFNACILALAPVHTARSVAPSTFLDLVRCRDLIVWDGASDHSIYGDPRVNHAFRAWHDTCHLLGGHDFTLRGEHDAAELQIRQMLGLYPRAPKLWLGIIRAEVTGQAEFFARTGAFPVNQAAFVADYLRG